jgi:hypothetical protein
MIAGDRVGMSDLLRIYGDEEIQAIVAYLSGLD